MRREVLVLLGLSMTADALAQHCRRACHPDETRDGRGCCVPVPATPPPPPPPLHVIRRPSHVVPRVRGGSYVRSPLRDAGCRARFGLVYPVAWDLATGTRSLTTPNGCMRELYGELGVPMRSADPTRRFSRGLDRLCCR